MQNYFRAHFELCFFARISSFDCRFSSSSPCALFRQVRLVSSAVMEGQSASNQQGGDEIPIEVGIMLAGANRELVNNLYLLLIEKGCNVDFLDYLDAGTSPFSKMDEFANSKNFVLYVATPDAIRSGTLTEQERHIMQYAAHKHKFRFAPYIPNQYLTINLPPSLDYIIPLKEDQWLYERLDKTLTSIKEEMHHHMRDHGAASAAEGNNNPLAQLPPVSDLVPKLQSSAVSVNCREEPICANSQGQSVDRNSAQTRSNEAIRRVECSTQHNAEDGTPV